MAAIFNHTDFWHLSGEEATNAMLKHNSKDFVTFSWVQGIMVCLVEPLIILGNAFVVYAVWKDPLKNLRCSPPNFILQSMAIADLLVGLLLSPMHAYWLFSLAVAQKSALSYHVIYSFSSTLYGSSLAHVTLLTIDRFVAVVQPLKYRSIMTRRRINLAISLVWLYFICFGSAAFVFVNGFFVMSIVFGVQMITLLQITFCFYGVIIYRLHKNYKAWQKRILRDNVRVSQQQLYVDKEGRHCVCNIYFSVLHNAICCAYMLGLFLRTVLLISKDAICIHWLGNNTFLFELCKQSFRVLLALSKVQRTFKTLL